MPRRDLPPSASVAHAGDDARMHAPAAERNAGAITEALQDIAPATGRALELASGTGQHAVAFARAMPVLDWQPSEVDAERRASIDAHAAATSLPNLRAAIPLDATEPGWGAGHAGQALIVLVNLLHLIRTDEAQTLIVEAARALDPGGVFAVYGPFLRAGRATSDGDARFHASLKAQDPDLGYKDMAEVQGWLEAQGLHPVRTLEMPANNLMLSARRPA
jgi:SAM-dependent methyltransferase